MTRHFLLHCSRFPSDYGDGGGCEYAVVSVDPKLAAVIAARRKAFLLLKAQEPALLPLRFWDEACWFLEDGIVGDESGDLVLHREAMLGRKTFEKVCDGPVEIDAVLAKDLEKYVARSECDRMIVDQDGVCWGAFPKHVDVRVETDSIPWNVIEPCLAQGVEGA